MNESYKSKPLLRVLNCVYKPNIYLFFYLRDNYFTVFCCIDSDGAQKGGKVIYKRQI